MIEMIMVKDDVCWLCGKHLGINNKSMVITQHHVLPQTLKPKKNICVPVHRMCHNKITSHDMNCLKNFAIRIYQESKELTKKTQILINQVKEFEKNIITNVI